MALPPWLTSIFARYRLPYQRHDHLPVYSANQLAHAEHTSRQRVAKPVFLAAGKRPVMVVVPASGRVDLGRVNEVLGVRELRVANEDEIRTWFKGCRPGCVPPVRLRADEVILMDRSLATVGTILFAGGSPEDAVSVPFRGWYRMVRPGVGRFVEEPAKTRARKQTVLVVEDEPDTNHLLCQLLEQRGFVCRGAANGQAALDLAIEFRPSAILLDLMLPDMSGFEMYARMRQVGPMRLPPALVVTALEDEATRRLGYDLGADAYLTKPFTPDKLLRELDCVLADSCA